MWPLRPASRPPPAPRCRGDQLRAAGEVESRRDERLAPHRVGVRLKHVDLGARLAQPLRETLLKRLLVTRRVTDIPGGGVKTDQLGGQRHELSPSAAIASHTFRSASVKATRRTLTLCTVRR